MAHRLTKNQTQLKRLSTHTSSYHQAVSMTVTGKKIRGGGEKPRLMVTSPLSHKFFLCYTGFLSSAHIYFLSLHTSTHTHLSLRSPERPLVKAVFWKPEGAP